MNSKFIITLMITLAFFIAGFILIDGILSYVFLYLDLDLIDGFLWNDVGTLISSVVWFFLVLLYFGYINEKDMEQVQDEFDSVTGIIKNFKHDKPNCDYPIVTDLCVEPLGKKFVCRFRIYHSEKEFILNEVIELDEKSCYDESLRLIYNSITERINEDKKRRT